jgi:amino-acid N-acetyltransferase
MISKIASDQEAMNRIAGLLRESDLPFQDLRLENNFFVTYYNDSNELVGSGGLELYGSYSLLRSVAVQKLARGKSIGKYIANDLIQNARLKSIKEIYLLTETARDFFIKVGFKDMSRDEVPEEVRASSEFASVCPVSAACMVYKL